MHGERKEESWRGKRGMKFARKMIFCVSTAEWLMSYCRQFKRIIHHACILLRYCECVFVCKWKPEKENHLWRIKMSRLGFSNWILQFVRAWSDVNDPLIMLHDHSMGYFTSKLLFVVLSLSDSLSPLIVSQLVRQTLYITKMPSDSSVESGLDLSKFRNRI